MPSSAAAILERMLAHRSIRKFRNESVADERLEACIRAAQMAATSSHVQGYSLIRITDPQKRARLVELTGNQAQVAEASAFYVVCADQRRHRLVAQRGGVNYVPNFETFLVAVIDASLFAQNFALALEADDLGVCYIGALRNDLPAVDQLLKLPSDVFGLFGLCVGVPAEDPKCKPRLPLDAIHFVDQYADDERLHELVESYDDTMAEYYGRRGLEGRNWTGGLVRKFQAAVRSNLSDYYASKGADLGPGQSADAQ